MFTKVLSYVILAACLPATYALANEFRIFKSTDGVEIEARLVKYKPQKGVTIIREDGQKFTVPLDRFSAEDQTFIKNWHKENAELMTEDSDFEVYIGAQKSKKGLGSSVGGQTQVEIIQPVVRITNKEWTEDFRGVEAVIAVIARDVRNKGLYKVLAVEKFEFEHIPKGTTIEWMGEKCETSWYDDDGDSYDDTRGHRYKGCVIAIRNRNGDHVYTKGTRSSWEGTYERIAKLRTRNTYDDKLGGY